MSHPLKATWLVAATLLALVLSGCGNQNPYGPNGVYDPYATDAYGNTGGLGTDYGSTGGYSDPYGSSTGSYGSDPYGSSTGGYSDPYGSTSGGYSDPYGSSTGGYPTTGASPLPGASPAPALTPSIADQAVLSAHVSEVKETGFLGAGKIIAKVEISNPTHRTLSGKLRVLFTDKGDPTANAITKRVTLRPLETQVLTFTADAWRLDDAEASIETDAPGASESVVADRTKK